MEWGTRNQEDLMTMNIYVLSNSKLKNIWYNNWQNNKINQLIFYLEIFKSPFSETDSLEKKEQRYRIFNSNSQTKTLKKNLTKYKCKIYITHSKL